MTEDLEQETKRQWFWWRIAVRYGIAAVIFVFFLTVSLHFGYTPDETYIYLQYGKNIAHGDGFAFNTGSPGAGLSGPFWALLIAGGSKINLDPYFVAKTLDIMFASFSILALLGFAFMLIRDHVYALVAAWIYSFDAWVLRWSGSGLDGSLGTLLTILVLWYTYRKEYLAASLVAGLLTLVRVEWGILFVVVLADLIVNATNRSAIVKMLAGSLFVYAVVVGSWIVVSLSIGGALPSLLPGSATVGMGASSLGGAALKGLKVIGGTQLMMAIVLVSGVIVSMKRNGWRSVREDGVPMLWILLLPLVLLLSGQDLGSRSLLPIVPVIVVYGVWGLKKVEIGMLLPIQRGLLVLTLVAIVSLVQNQAVYHRWVHPHMEGVELGVNECLKPMGYWLRSHAPAGSTVLAPEVGVVGYISGRNVSDPRRIVNPSLGQALRGLSYDEGMTQGRYQQILHPDYVIDRSSAPARLSSATLKPVMIRPFSGLGVLNPETVYYTLYEVVQP